MGNSSSVAFKRREQAYISSRSVTFNLPKSKRKHSKYADGRQYAASVAGESPTLKPILRQSEEGKKRQPTDTRSEGFSDISSRDFYDIYHSNDLDFENEMNETRSSHGVSSMYEVGSSQDRLDRRGSDGTEFPSGITGRPKSRHDDRATNGVAGKDGNHISRGWSADERYGYGDQLGPQYPVTSLDRKAVRANGRGPHRSTSMAPLPSHPSSYQDATRHPRARSKKHSKAPAQPARSHSTSALNDRSAVSHFTSANQKPSWEGVTSVAAVTGRFMKKRRAPPPPLLPKPSMKGRSSSLSNCSSLSRRSEGDLTVAVLQAELEQRLGEREINFTSAPALNDIQPTGPVSSLNVVSSSSNHQYTAAANPTPSRVFTVAADIHSIAAPHVNTTSFPAAVSTQSLSKASPSTVVTPSTDGATFSSSATHAALVIPKPSGSSIQATRKSAPAAAGKPTKKSPKKSPKRSAALGKPPPPPVPQSTSQPLPVNGTKLSSSIPAPATSPPPPNPSTVQGPPISASTGVPAAVASQLVGAVFTTDERVPTNAILVKSNRKSMEIQIQTDIPWCDSEPGQALPDLTGETYDKVLVAKERTTVAAVATPSAEKTTREISVQFNAPREIGTQVDDGTFMRRKTKLEESTEKQSQQPPALQSQTSLDDILQLFAKALEGSDRPLIARDTDGGETSDNGASGNMAPEPERDYPRSPANKLVTKITRPSIKVTVRPKPKRKDSISDVESERSADSSGKKRMRLAEVLASPPTPPPSSTLYTENDSHSTLPPGVPPPPPPPPLPGQKIKLIHTRTITADAPITFAAMDDSDVEKERDNDDDDEDEDDNAAGGRAAMSAFESELLSAFARREEKSRANGGVRRSHSPGGAGGRRKKASPSPSTVDGHLLNVYRHSATVMGLGGDRISQSSSSTNGFSQSRPSSRVPLPAVAKEGEDSGHDEPPEDLDVIRARLSEKVMEDVVRAALRPATRGQSSMGSSSSASSSIDVYGGRTETAGSTTTDLYGNSKNYIGRLSGSTKGTGIEATKATNSIKRLKRSVRKLIVNSLGRQSMSLTRPDSPGGEESRVAELSLPPQSDPNWVLSTSIRTPGRGSLKERLTRGTNGTAGQDMPPSWVQDTFSGLGGKKGQDESHLNSGDKKDVSLTLPTHQPTFPRYSSESAVSDFLL